MPLPPALPRTLRRRAESREPARTPRMSVTLDLELRNGWPAELRALLDVYPRDTWLSHPNSGLAQFWLERHEMFRRHAAELKAATGEYREGRREAVQFQHWLAPRLQSFIAHLHGHHQVEDHHYFPVFRAADARLGRGFDVLDKDHQVLHDALVSLVGVANEFLTSQDAEALKRSGERCATAINQLHAHLHRHLADEEDLIIPVMLHHQTG
jgi:iron-sulfur cluster repair protein YtfE (RIC family)